MRRREDDPRTHPHCDPCQGPARYCCPVSCLRHLEIVNASDVLDDAVATVIPDVHAEGEMRLGFHGQVPLDSSWPAGIYSSCCCVRHLGAIQQDRDDGNVALEGTGDDWSRAPVRVLSSPDD